jgi:glycosyltransferase involved in cell wall biosynthesis
MSQKLSVVIITLNEEKNIGRCLHAAWQVADEVVVVDSYSTDNTKQICLDVGVNFIEHDFEGYIQQKNFAISQSSYDLVLSIDADEVLSNELISSILKVKQNPIYSSYSINRMSHYVDRFIKHGHWYPDIKIRLFKKDVGRWTGKNPHDQFVLTSDHKTVRLKGIIYHYTFNSIFEHLAQANKFSEIGSKQFDDQPSLFLVLKAIFSPLWGFIFGYIGRLGFLDGWRGLTISIIASTETFLKYTKALTQRYMLSDEQQEKPNPSVSLIISTYNWPEALKQCLESVKKQVVYPNEVIIADDGSTDETIELINEFKKDFPIPLIHSWIEDRGFRLAKSRNEALKLAKYEYIVQIDGDIILNKHFIDDHAQFARKGTFVRGSRVLLNAEATKRIFNNQVSNPNIFMEGTVNFFNGIRIPFLQNLLTKRTRSIKGIRGCNMGYWKEDAYTINGYNEQIEGWGREDSEFVARMVNNGMHKRNLRLGGIEFHIYHNEYDRKLLNKNDDVLNMTLSKKLTSCEFGIITLDPENIN